MFIIMEHPHKHPPKTQNPHSQRLRGFVGGPTWTRTNLLNISLSIVTSLVNTQRVYKYIP